VDLVIAQVTSGGTAGWWTSQPTRTNVSEVVVTGPGAPAIASATTCRERSLRAQGQKYYESVSR